MAEPLQAGDKALVTDLRLTRIGHVAGHVAGWAVREHQGHAAGRGQLDVLRIEAIPEAGADGPEQFVDDNLVAADIAHP